MAAGLLVVCAVAVASPFVLGFFLPIDLGQAALLFSLGFVALLSGLGMLIVVIVLRPDAFRRYPPDD